MGQAVQSWGSEHGDLPPWATYVDEGGLRSRTGTRTGNAWFEYLFLSNYLVTPRILACPADKGVRVASDWGGAIETGFLRYRAGAVSYNLELHSSSDRPRSVISTDLNLRFAVGVFGCSVGVDNPVRLDLSPSPQPDTYWTNAIHGLSGHLLLTDGSVELTDSAGVGTLLFIDPPDNYFPHFLKAR